MLLALALGCFGLCPRAHGTPSFNTYYGSGALFSNTTGIYNTAIGWAALGLNTTGNANTATGGDALKNNTVGYANTANGVSALFSNTTGYYNTANGASALYNNIIGSSNTATGHWALLSNTDGNFNTANGESALYSNTTGAQNTASGFGALHDNTIGTYNTAIGLNALFKNTTAGYNTASGYQALFGNTSGTFNTANGVSALSGNTGGNYNTASGFNALASNSTGSNNVAVGYQAGYNLTTGSNNIDIGNAGVAGDAGKIRIGKGASGTYIAGIFGKTAASGVPVIIDSKGHLGTTQSSARYKKAIRPMAEASEDLLKLEPVTFQYKEELDPEGVPQFGLIAEQVAKANPDLVIRDEEGEVTTVRYEAVNAMLLNEFLKEHRNVEEQHCRVQELNATVARQEAAISQLKKEFDTAIAQQQKQIEALTATVQNVSDELRLRKRTPQMAVNNR